MAQRKSSKATSVDFFNGVLIGAGILIFLFGTFFKISLPSATNLPREVKFEVPQASWPKKLMISRINVNVPIIVGGIVKGEWILNDNTAFYLPTSGRLNEGFNTVIYAHRLPNLFASLGQIKPGDLIEVFDQNDKKFVYKVFAVESVKPNDLDKIKSRVKNSLTMFTCDGWLDQTRLVVKAKMNLLEDQVSVPF